MPRKPSPEQVPREAHDSAGVLDRLADAMAADGGPRVFLQDSVPDKYSFVAAPAIDCENRVELCKAACCRLTFPLSQQDIEEGIAAWNQQHPFLNAQDSKGYCVHLENQACRCSIYASRPAPCRAFDCRNDRRIWIDFENRIPNPALEALDWPLNLASELQEPPRPPAHNGEHQEDAGTKHELQQPHRHSGACTAAARSAKTPRMDDQPGSPGRKK